MFKIIGAAIIIIATTWAGFEAAKKLSMRPRQLRQLKVAMQSLEAEIMYGHTPLKEAARKLSKQMAKPLSIFSRPLQLDSSQVRPPSKKHGLIV